jgi:glycopeptide antibiotics resistance protein
MEKKPIWYKALYIIGVVIIIIFIIIFSHMLFLRYTEPELFLYQAEFISHIPYDSIAPSIEEVPLKYEYPFLYWVSLHEWRIFAFLLLYSAILFFSQNLYKSKKLKDKLESDT